MFQLISHSFAVVTVTNRCRMLYFFTGKRLQSGLYFYSLSSTSKDTTQSLHPHRYTYSHNAGVERQQKHHARRFQSCFLYLSVLGLQVDPCIFHQVSGAVLHIFITIHIYRLFVSYQPPKQMAGRSGSKRTHWHAREKGRKAETRINESPLLWTVAKESLQSIAYTWASTWQSAPAFDFSQAQFKVWILICKPLMVAPWVPSDISLCTIVTAEVN